MVSGNGTKERSTRARISSAGRARRCVGRTAVGGAGSSEGGGGVGDCICEEPEGEASVEPLAGVDLDLQKFMLCDASRIVVKL
jgi:hypothetical protein